MKESLTRNFNLDYNTNKNIMNLSKVDKTKLTKQRNREIKRLKKEIKKLDNMNNNELGQLLDSLKSQKRDYFKQQKNTQKENYKANKALPDPVIMYLIQNWTENKE